MARSTNRKGVKVSGGEITFGVITAVIAGAALFVAIFNRLDNKKVAQQSQIANDTAAGAFAESQKATRLSEEANEIARKANDLVRQTLVASVDPIIYKWRLETDSGGFVGVLTNDCAHAAIDVAVLIDIDGRPVLTLREDRVSEFAKVPLILTSEYRKFLDRVREQEERPRAIFGTTGREMVRAAYRSDSVELVTRATVTCVTPNGTPRRDVIESSVRYYRKGSEVMRVEERSRKPRRE
jgi:hypothetical protein